jgi:peptide/nickel transport system permease protein
MRWLIAHALNLAKRWRTVARLFRRMPVISILILMSLVVAAIFAPFIAPYSPIKGSLPDKFLPPAWVEGGNSDFMLGTDHLGRDILSRLIYAARISLTVALLAVFFAGTLGTIIGLISGYFGGLIDILLMRLTDIGLSLPMILVALVLVAVLGPSYTNVILVIILLLWPRYARQIRGEALSIKLREHIDLARVAGCSDLRILSHHIFPNILSTFLVLATLQVGFVIILESTLSFLGVGIPPPTPSWGTMVSDGRAVISTGWWVFFWPALAILFTVLAGNLLGDWLRDRLDPKLREV